MKRFIASLLIVFSLTAKAQQTEKQSHTFTLKQAIEHALQYNYSSINANRDIEISKQKKWETTAGGLPQINAGVDYQNFLKQPISLADLNQDGVNEEFVFGTRQNMTGKVTLNQLIFDGSYIVALQASKAYLEYFVNAKKKTDSEIRAMVTSSYGNVLLAEESTKVLERNQTILEKNYSDINQIYKNGLGEEESVEQIAITLASIKSSLSNVKRLKEISLKMLKINLGVEINDDLKLSDNLDTLSRNNLDLALSTSEFEINNSIDYQIASSLVTQKRLLLKLEKSKALPSLSSFVNLGATANSNTFTFANASQKWFASSLLGVSLNVPIFSSFARSARSQQARIAFEQSKTQQTETEQMLKLQYQKAKSDFEFSVEEYATAKSNLNLAERIERKQQIKFKEGLSTSFEFSEAQRQLYATQQSYLQSMVDVINKRAALEKITNKN
ncbi:TolC family protein [Flavobacterium sp.]|uniref:TolC family protein n=1 Tax=Flavobacterium sp. TaxID=239 RepID=UPI00286E33A9|nr:TolC family protein [Flavobacterium sp.]